MSAFRAYKSSYARKYSSALRLFSRMVARMGSFTPAGKELGLSQPSVSRIINTLERDLGIYPFSAGQHTACG